jgi:hypothetical protein
MLTRCKNWGTGLAAFVAGAVLAALSSAPASATPANRAALDRHYDRFLTKELNRCTTCHLASDRKEPKNLEEFPHNAFGDRLRRVGEELATAGKPKDIASRLTAIAAEDSDGDGVANEVELLLGHNPGVAKDKPSKKELAATAERQVEFAKFLESYRWRPFDTVKQPEVPKSKGKWARNPVDAFIAAEHAAQKLKARPEADRLVLLRRVYLDLIGLSPTPEEQRAFLADKTPDAYEKVVDRLLADSRHGERWGRHWMDVWRYSDWAGWSDGNQIRDSKPHIWRWRDWIVESLNADKGYDRMVLEMLAADEAAPLDTNALRATGFLVRNYKMLSREQWMEDTIKHTSQAFLGVTVGCARCHDHMMDPISQRDYYRMRAIFEPHNVRTDKLPGQLDVAKDGLVRAFDTATNRATYLFIRGDERHPDTNRVIEPGVPLTLCGLTREGKSGGELRVEPVKLPFLAAQPDHRGFVIRDVVAASEKSLAEARAALEKLKTNSPAETKLREQELTVAAAEAKHVSLLVTLRAEKIEDDGRKDSEDWKQVAIEALAAQRKTTVEEAQLKAHQARTTLTEAQQKADDNAKAATNATASAKADGDKAKPKKDSSDKLAKDLEAAKKKAADADKALAEAEKELQTAPGTAYKPRAVESFPDASSGRRLAFARWVTDTNNPLTARVAMNHLWLRHFGRGLVPTPADFGRNGRPPSHPQLLDWLASEFMAHGWSMKAMHRLIVTSSTYRMASTPDDDCARRDPDNVSLWRMPSRRLEAEAVRDNLLYVTGNLDLAMGGPDIDHKLGLTSKRRSLYLRLAAEKEVEFLKIFDGPSVTECYERRPSVMPQQALALANSELALAEARLLAKALSAEARDDAEFVRVAFTRILARPPTREELRLCEDFLNGRAALTPISNSPATRSATRSRENLVLVLFNHNDFVTIR